MESNAKNTVFKFLKNVTINNATGCHQWNGSVCRRYGRFNISGKSYRAHRLAYKLFLNEDPGDKFVCHKCDNPLCVNPDHLFLGTPADNTKDRDEKGRTARGESRSKIKIKDVIRIRELSNSGLTRVEVAKIIGISKSQVHNIVAGLNWKHV